MGEIHRVKSAISTLANNIYKQEEQINQLRHKIKDLAEDTEFRQNAAFEDIQRAKHLLAAEKEKIRTLCRESYELQSDLRLAMTNAEDMGRQNASIISFYENECGRLKNDLLYIGEEEKSKWWEMWKWIHPYGTVFAMAGTFAYISRPH